MKIENPFESGQIKNYLLFYAAIVVIMILFFIASSLFNDVKQEKTKIFDTNTTVKKIPLIIGVLTSMQMAAKVRLYRRFLGIPVGAFFVHNADWVAKQQPAEEDYWRIPRLSKLLSKQTHLMLQKREKVS